MLRSSVPQTLLWLLVIILFMLGPLALPAGAQSLTQGTVASDDLPFWAILPLIMGCLLGVRSLSRHRS